MKYLISTLVFLSALSSYAIDAGTRGGGNALICFEDPRVPSAIRRANGEIKDENIGSISSIQMLDIYEVSLQQGMENAKTVELMPILKDESISAFSKRMISRIEDFAPELYANLTKAMEAMPPNKSFAHPYGIENVKDFDLMGKINSQLCVVGTILYHIPKGQMTEIHYDQRLWNHAGFDTYNKYVAYFHEVVYSTLRKTLQEKNSDKARMLVGMLIQKNFDHEKFMRFVIDNSQYPYQGATIKKIIAEETYTSTLAYGEPLFKIKYLLTPAQLGREVKTYREFLKRYTNNPSILEILSPMQKSTRRDYISSLSPEGKRELDRLLAKDFSREYKSYLVAFRKNAFALAKSIGAESLQRLEQLTYYSAEQKQTIFAGLNKYFNQSTEEHEKAVNSYTDFKNEDQTANDVEAAIFKNVQIKLSNYYPLQGQF